MVFWRVFDEFVNYRRDIEEFPMNYGWAIDVLQISTSYRRATHKLLTSYRLPIEYMTVKFWRIIDAL